MKNQKIHYAWYIMIACCFMQAGVLGILANCSGIFFTPICEELGFGRGDLSFYVTIRGIFAVLSLPLAGRMIPRKNIRVLLSSMIAVAATAFAAMGFFTELWQWYVAGAIIGFCSSFVFFVPASILIGNWFEKRLGLAMGIALAFSGVGGAIFNPVGTALIGMFGWRATQVIMGCLSMALSLPFTLFVIRFKPADLNMKAYGAGETTEGAKPLAETGVELRDATHSITLPLMIVLAGFMAFGAAYSNHLPSFAISIGFTAAVGATLTSCSMIGNILGKLLLGMLNDKIGVKKTTVVGLGIVCLAYLSIVWSGNNLPLLCIAACFSGFSMAVCALILPLLVRSIFGNKEYSQLFAYVSMGSNLTSSVAVTIVGYIYDALGSYNAAFYLGSLNVAVAVVLVFATYATAKKLKDSPVNA